MQGGLHRGQQMPGLDLCAAGLYRQGSALFPEKGNQAAAAQARIHLGRGAVTSAGWFFLLGEAMTKRVVSNFSLLVAVALLTLAANLASAAAAQIVAFGASNTA